MPDTDDETPPPPVVNINAAGGALRNDNQQQAGTSNSHTPFISLSDIISHIRKYDGIGKVEDWLGYVESDREEFGLTYSFLCRNLDRFLEGDAKRWYQSNLPEYLSAFNRNQDEDDFERTWRVIKIDFCSFFDHTSMQSHYRAKNKSLTFSWDQSPQSYVASKLEILRHCDPQMSETKKVQNLIRGLPTDLQTIFAAQSFKNPNEFVVCLRSLAEIRHQSKKEEKPSTSNSNISMKQLDHNAQKKSNPSRTPNRSTPDGKPICNFCGKPFHTWRSCWLRDPSLKPQGGNNQNRNSRRGGSNEQQNRQGQGTGNQITQSGAQRQNPIPFPQPNLPVNPSAMNMNVPFNNFPFSFMNPFAFMPFQYPGASQHMAQPRAQQPNPNIPSLPNPQNRNNTFAITEVNDSGNELAVGYTTNGQ
ncbi:unnamed protein product [Orchesella dallaii]|uniref:Retrotransposon gag domain-containing protein n=1 Tax=Orchesella dallaii TaxID=48710 RepID=A0ABP1R0B7_9HEXA